MGLLLALYQLALLIEGALLIIYGVVRGRLDYRGFVYAGAALLMAYLMPTVVSSLIGVKPGEALNQSYELLYSYALDQEHAWSSIYYVTTYTMLVHAAAMTVLNALVILASLGIGAVPLQELLAMEDLGWVIDPVMALVDSINHAAQVMVAVWHTIAYMAWFSYAIAPAILAVAIPLLIMRRTRGLGWALILITLATMFFTALASATLHLYSIAQYEAWVNETMAEIGHDIPSGLQVRGFMELNAPLPYLVGGVLYTNYTLTTPPRGPPTYEPLNISWFLGVPNSVGLVNEFAYPSITNVTFLWLDVTRLVNYQCNLVMYIGNDTELEPCEQQYFGGNDTFIEAITLSGLPFELLTTANGTVGAWQWLEGPSGFRAVPSGGGSVTITYTLDVPPERCVNIAQPRGPPERVCYPGTASASLWAFAHGIINQGLSIPSNVTCTVAIVNSTRFKVVDIAEDEDLISQFMGKVINEAGVGSELFLGGRGHDVSYSLPNPEPTGYVQEEYRVYCENWSNETKAVTGLFTVVGNTQNPWFGYSPILITPIESWVVDAPIVGNTTLLLNWWGIGVTQFLGSLGAFFPQWLGEVSVITGLLDAGAWVTGLPSVMAPAWSVLSSAIMDLSLVLYLRMSGISRLLQRLFRRARAHIGSRARSAMESIGDRLTRASRGKGVRARAAGALLRVTRAVSGGLGIARPGSVLDRALAGHPRLAGVVRVMLSPLHEGLGIAVRRLEDSGHRRAAASLTFIRDYGQIASEAQRGQLVRTHFFAKALSDRYGAHYWLIRRREGIKAPGNPGFSGRRGELARASLITRGLSPETHDQLMRLARETKALGRLVTAYLMGDRPRAVFLAMVGRIHELTKPIADRIRELESERSWVLYLISDSAASWGPDKLPRLYMNLSHLGSKLGINGDKLVDTYWGLFRERYREYLKQYMGKPPSRIAARVRDEVAPLIKPIIDVVKSLRQGAVFLSEEALMSALGPLAGDAGVRAAVSRWFNERYRPAIDAVLRDNKDRIMERVRDAQWGLARELLSALAPVIKARAREALMKEASGEAMRRAHAEALGSALRGLPIADYLRGLELERDSLLGRLKDAGKALEALLTLPWGLESSDKSLEALVRGVPRWVLNDGVLRGIVMDHVAQALTESLLREDPLITITEHSLALGVPPLTILLLLLEKAGVDPEKLGWGLVMSNAAALREWARALRAYEELTGRELRLPEELRAKVDLAHPSDSFREFHRGLRRETIKGHWEFRDRELRLGGREVSIKVPWPVDEVVDLRQFLRSEAGREFLMRFMPGAREVMLNLENKLNEDTEDLMNKVRHALTGRITNAPSPSGAQIIEKLNITLNSVERALGDRRLGDLARSLEDLAGVIRTAAQLLGMREDVLIMASDAERLAALARLLMGLG